MATAISNTSTASTQPGERLFTVADLAAMPHDLPSGWVDFELDNGRFVVMSPPGHRHGRMQVKLGSLFLAQGEEKGHGEAHTETGVVLRRNPDSVVGPDVSFIKQESLPVREAPEGYLETIPELVVEIKSKKDTLQEMAEKAEEYLAAGVQHVWIFDPIAQQVVEYVPSAKPRTYQAADTLQCESIVPGMRLVLSELFSE